ncbi:MAG: hypothetical protein AABZ14_08050 [Candidatus Margulisiibacteriota bacterium]
MVALQGAEAPVTSIGIHATNPGFPIGVGNDNALKDVVTQSA